MLLMVAYAHAQSAQQPASVPTPTFSVSSRLVVLDVVVRDRKGHLVSDLARRDFTVREDKAPQTILSFETPKQHRLPPNVEIDSTADLVKAPDAPVTLLVLDELNTNFQDMSYARRELEKYLMAQPAVLPQPTTLLAADNTKFQVLEDYTRDRGALLSALGRHFPEYPWRLMQSGKGGPGAAQRLAMSLGSLEQIAQATAGHPGRKSLIWVGRGFPAVNTNESTDQEAATIRSTVEQVIDALRDDRITLTIIDPTIMSTDTVEIQTPDDLDAAEDSNGNDPFQGDVNFQLLAPATGGDVYYARNDVDAEINTAIRNGDNYYTLSYAPTNRNDAAEPYRRISVMVDRPGLTVTTRNGYYIPSAQPKPAQTAQNLQDLRARLAFDLGSAINSNIAYTGLSATVIPVPGHAGSFVMRVSTQALNWRTMSDGSLEAEVTLAAACFNRQGKMMAHTAEERTAHLAGNRQTLQGMTDFPLTMPIPKHTARVRFVVRDATTGKIGTMDFDLTHP